ncbi:hypothetical protein KL921_003737 [Ogataea angusta]|uniref:Helicase C-terminal domain-containing protein n=1 Tax=Pichia angusta TaxID=870730 RepID=A0AAN6I459_PICAN|nr:uncharacterized protein KL928_003977 [Ogataea angusta]KAG7808655.1 hypothetical protein KL921_003737 [Ogataea angusta]KAG7817242.1 hypothetical protein KL928_003977 [Ogataea angusta]KAG7823560.1 hypothetical protein KL909_002957 [Ogataea angusta]KAG7828747.1 hypothetical protein KL920_003243 [Ogataea angusta]KAG7833268.1 hypothetical protein KL943_004133 [Ogataea angusta]
MPGNVEDYVHRIGRTGRAGEKGTAITMFTESNSGQAHDLITILREAKQEIPPQLQALDKKGNRGNGYGYGRGRGGYGRGRGGYGRGGRGGRGGSRGFSGSNSAPLGNRRF